MQNGVERQLSKGERQKLVASLVERMRLGTQQELLDALESAGCQVTQATVSRDIRELALEKTRDPLGRLRYMLPNRERRIDPRETLMALLAQFGRGAVAVVSHDLASRCFALAPNEGGWIAVRFRVRDYARRTK